MDVVISCVAESKDVAEIVHGFLSRGDPAFAATRFLIAKAAMAWSIEEGDYRDDISVIVIFLPALMEALSSASASSAARPRVLDAP